MDDMHAFERQVERRIQHFVGPVYPVDDLAVLDAVIATSRSQRWGFTAFSTLKFVAAAAIVALFGGFLFVGVLTTQQGDELAPAAVPESPSPMTTEELLLGMVTEEVEPGVLRVVNDGYRGIGQPRVKSALAEAVVVDNAGGVWRVTQVGGDWSAMYFRLGAETEQLIGPGSKEYDELTHAALNFVVTADGRLVSPWSEELVLVDGEPVTPTELGLDNEVQAIGVQDDGTVWLLDRDDDIVRVKPDGAPEILDWRVADDAWVDRFTVTPDGEVWLTGVWGEGQGSLDSLVHFDGSEWEAVPPPDEVARQGYSLELDGGPDGTLWTSGDSADPRSSLARYDGTGWTIFAEPDGVQPWGSQGTGPYDWPFTMLQAAPDGSVWVNAWTAGIRHCGGLARFDGTTWSSYLSGMCISDYDFAPDGAVWVVAEDVLAGSGFQTYVINPHAAKNRPSEEKGEPS